MKGKVHAIESLIGDYATNQNYRIKIPFGNVAANGKHRSTWSPIGKP
jgi:hypothetical protein